jgi:hypothetical protein
MTKETTLYITTTTEISRHLREVPVSNKLFIGDIKTCLALEKTPSLLPAKFLRNYRETSAQSPGMTYTPLVN